MKGLIEEQKRVRETERLSEMERKKEAMEKEMREREIELVSTARSLQAQEHNVQLAEEQVHN